MATTTNMAIPYPASSDYVADGANNMEDIALQVDAKVGLVHIKTQAIQVSPAVSDVTVTDVFSSTFDDYRIVISGYDVNIASGWLRFQLDPTHTSGYYGLAYNRFFAGDATEANNNAAYMTLARIHNDVGKQNAIFDITSPYLTTYKMISAFSGGFVGWNAAGGQIDKTTSFTDFTIFPSSGTLSGGYVKVYGYSNG